MNVNDVVGVVVDDTLTRRALTLPFTASSRVGRPYEELLPCFKKVKGSCDFSQS